MNQPQPLPHLQSLSPYHVAEAAASPGKLIRLSFNEGALGISPLALAAYQNAAGTLQRYPDLNYTALRQAIAADAGLEADRIVCGAGSDELLGHLARGYATAGDEVIYSQYGFSMYGIVTKLTGATPVVIPERNFTLDTEALLAAVTPRTRLIFIANPNNPTGSYISKDVIHRLHAALPSSVLLVLDSAYAEFMTVPDYSDGLELATHYPNVVVLRTFSKIHALGGLRIGWSYGSPSVANTLNSLRNPFNIAAPAAAAAIASLGDKDFLRRSREHNTEWRDWLMAQLRQIGGFDAHPSVANFILTGVSTAERASALLRFLAERRIQVRGMGGYKLPDHIRITIGTAEEMRELAAVLQAFRTQES